jgi:VanZ family protein
VGDAAQRRRRTRAWSALGLWIVLILLASSDVFSAANTQSWLGQPQPRGTATPAAHVALRALFHLVEYGVLGFLAFRALALAAGRGGVAAAGLGTLLALTVSISDETLQGYQPNRSGSPRDVVLNLFGAMGGASLAAVRFARRTRDRSGA